MVRRRLASRPAASLCLVALAWLQGCSSMPGNTLAWQREEFPVELDFDRPLQILRWEADRYTCAPGIRMVCDGATRMYLLCKCPSIPPLQLQ